MKQTRLLEIIREEISNALGEAGLGDQIASLQKTKDAFEKQKAPITKKEADISKKIADLEKKQADAEVKAGSTLEEDVLNEMAYDIIISLPNELAKLQDKIKDSTKKGEQKLAKALEIIQKTKKEGKPIRQRDIANEMGLIQQEINPLINKLIDVGILEKGESVTGVTKKKVTDKAQGRPAGESKAEKPASTGKKGRPAGEPKTEKTATLTKGDDGFDTVEDSDADNDKEATQNIGSDSTAKKLGNLATGKEETFNRILGLVEKYKDDKDKVDAFINKAKNEYKLSKTLLDQLKRVAGRDVKI
jgi:hypothetical protein